MKADWLTRLGTFLNDLVVAAFLAVTAVMAINLLLWVSGLWTQSLVLWSSAVIVVSALAYVLGRAILRPRKRP